MGGGRHVRVPSVVRCGAQDVVRALQQEESVRVDSASRHGDRWCSPRGWPLSGFASRNVREAGAASDHRAKPV
ncbi:hypothetical protein CEB94_05750 [Streptomyces hawaiiensis]|uniref:Uncharacterized protein n=1 Tax=Streptomyces hawaiiensis TaxID=67305 RepID=A0A6G5R9A9_9ACTN|nr:hypothetical protein CEB94_05750 [Streptomyces hawaiiensis]